MASAHEYESLRTQGMQAIDAGNLEMAAEFFEQALATAQVLGEQRRIDTASCNRALPLIELGKWEEPLRELRELLLRARDTENRYLASYHVARIHELRRQNKKALFYARTAREHALAVGRPAWVAASHNQVGNLLLAESHAAEAYEAYRSALELMPEQSPTWRARILDNLGYCELLRGDHRSGFALLFQSLRCLRRAGARRYEVSTRLDLCFGFLEISRWSRALHHGQIALALSEETADPEGAKNALYLLGEAANMAGDVSAARAFFTQLQQRFYPGNPFIPDFLLTVDVRKIISLRA